MAIKRDLSALRNADKEVHLPDTTARFAPRLAEAWAATVDQGDKAFAHEDTMIRHSWAGGCARRIAYDIAGAEKTEPLTLADHWRFGIGTLAHERWQEVMVEAFPEAEVEVKVRIDEIPSSGHIDLVLREMIEESTPDDDGGNVHVTAMELKTINGFGFKAAIGARGEAEGPRHSALLQGALNAHAVDADELVIVYLSLENLSPRELNKMWPGGESWQRFAAEWTYTRDEYEPLAEAEISRLRRIVEFVEAGDEVPRLLSDPPGAIVINPVDQVGYGRYQVVARDGTVLGEDTTWVCAYCSYRTRCAIDLGG